MEVEGIVESKTKNPVGDTRDTNCLSLWALAWKKAQ